MRSGRKARKLGGRREANSTAETVELPTHTDGKALNCPLKGHSAQTEAAAGPSASDFEAQRW